MTHPDDLYAEAQRIRRSTLRWRWAMAILAVVLVASGTAFALTGPLQASDDDTPTASAPTVPGVPTTTTAPSGGPEQPDPCGRPLTSDDPLRLWIGGDSLAGSLGPSLGEITGATGVVQPVFHSRISSGLGSKDFYDWPARAPEDFVRYDPEVAVFIIGTNDAKALPQNAASDDRWRQQYTDLVEEMLQVLIGDGRTVYWVGAPIMKERAFSERVQVVNTIFQDVVARHPEAHYVDSFELFSDADGRYAASLPNDNDNDNEKNVTVREGDGVHLTLEGGNRLAEAVFDQLDPECTISRQAVEDEEKRTIEIRGGSSAPRRTGSTPTVAPTNATPTTVIVTTPPTTAPPTTAPPSSVPASTIVPPTPPTFPCQPPACRGPGVPPTSPR